MSSRSRPLHSIAAPIGSRRAGSQDKGQMCVHLRTADSEKRGEDVLGFSPTQLWLFIQPRESIEPRTTRSTPLLSAGSLETSIDPNGTFNGLRLGDRRSRFRLKGTAPPFFWIHGGDNDVMLRYLIADQSLYKLILESQDRGAAPYSIV